MMGARSGDIRLLVSLRSAPVSANIHHDGSCRGPSVSSARKEATRPVPGAAEERISNTDHVEGSQRGECKWVYRSSWERAPPKKEWKDHLEHSSQAKQLDWRGVFR